MENACCEFDVETLMPTFKLLIGIPGKSNAFSISKKLGLSDRILERAKKLVTSEEKNFEDVLINLEKNLFVARKDREDAELALREAKLYKAEISQQQEKINDKREKILEKANEKARAVLSDAISDIDDIIKGIKDNIKDQSSQQQINIAREAKQNIMKRLKAASSSLSSDNDEETQINFDPNFINNLKVGDSVILKNLNQPATVISAPDKNGDVRVLVGVIKMNTNISNLKQNMSTKKSENVKSRGIGKIVSSKSQYIKSEINLLGYNVDSATMELDKYLDDAHLSNLKEIRIVHGKGTGALRVGIHKFLKNHPHVDTYRIGVYGEGENGVSIVQLK